MRRFPRIRNASKWTCAALAALVLVAWVLSGGVQVYLEVPPRTSLCLSSGRLVAWRDDSRLTYAGFDWFMVRVEQWHYEWSFFYDGIRTPGRNGAIARVFAVPLWVLLVPMLAGTNYLWRRDIRLTRAKRAGLCTTCGYDRSGLPAGAVCPECAAAATTTA